MHMYISFVRLTHLLRAYWGFWELGTDSEQSGVTRCPPRTCLLVNEVGMVASSPLLLGTAALPSPPPSTVQEGGGPRAEVVAPQQAPGLVFNQLVSPVHRVGRPGAVSGSHSVVWECLGVSETLLGGILIFKL